MQCMYQKAWRIWDQLVKMVQMPHHVKHTRPKFRAKFFKIVHIPGVFIQQDADGIDTLNLSWNIMSVNQDALTFYYGVLNQFHNHFHAYHWIFPPEWSHTNRFYLKIWTILHLKISSKKCIMRSNLPIHCSSQNSGCQQKFIQFNWIFIHHLPQNK